MSEKRPPAPRAKQATKPFHEAGLVEDGELVVHVAGEPGHARPGHVVHLHGDAGGLELVDVGAGVVGLLVVGDNPHLHAAAVGVEDGVRDTIVRDGEDAQVEGAARLADAAGEVPPAAVAG